MLILIELVLWIVIILLSILLTLAVRRIPVQYARRQTSGSTTDRSIYGSRQYIPLKLNASGVMPIIFAQAIMFAPVYIGGALGDSSAGQWIQANFSDIFGLLFWHLNIRSFLRRFLIHFRPPASSKTLPLPMFL